MELSKEIATPAFLSQRVWLIAILVAILHAAMAVTAVNTKSPTFDEPQHLTAGYSYWVTNDFRLDPENGNLPARWAALPLLLSHPNFVPLNDRGWQRAEEGRTGHQFFYEVGDDPDRTLGQARMMMSIFGAALCLLMYRCGREFFGVGGGLLAETVAAFDPNFLAHSALVTADVPAAFFFTAAVWTSWRLFQKISPATLAITALSLAGLFLTKFSAPIVLPVIGAMSILRIFDRREINLKLGRFRIGWIETWKKACAIAGSWLLLAATVFFAIWLSFSFRYSAWTNNESSHEKTTWHWNYLLEDSGTFESAVRFSRAHRLLPEAYLYGFAYVHKHEIDRPAFLDNQWSVVGFRSFFPRAFIYKTPLPFLLLVALAFYAALARRHSWRISNLNQLADSSVDWGQDLPALKTWLDNHPAIVNGKPLYLAYFGTADPRSYEINARLLPENHSSGDRAFAPRTGGIYCISATTLQSVYTLELGPWCAPYEQYYQAAAAEIRRYHNTVSDPARRVAMIANDGARNWAKKFKDFERLRFERLCAYLRHQAPAAQIGYSVFVFELTDDAVNRALYGPPAELTREVCVSGF